MKVFFSALHFAYFRNFESAIRALVERGHDVHLSADEAETFGGRELAERLATEYRGGNGRGAVTFSLAPSLDQEPWFAAARGLRLGLDYVRALAPRYAGSPKMRARTRDRAPRIVRWMSSIPAVGAPVTTAALKKVERLLPRSRAMEEYLRGVAPDVALLASLTYSRSQQLDQLKAARALGIPVGAAIMSWDHLSSKALLHVAPDMVLVWNDVQRHEATEMHGLPGERVVATGAHSYDHWFSRRPDRTREELARALGLREDRPFVLYVCSALSPTPQPPEPVLVRRWIEALRASGDSMLKDIGVLVRPHPERLKEWADVTLDGLDNVAFHGRNPIDSAAKSDYFDSLYHSSAVVGLVTSAFLEAALLGKPVLTFTLPEYRLHQEEMLHFQYLTTVEGGVLQTSPDFATHFAQLRAAIADGGQASERNRRFVQSFIRPAGLDRPAAPLFADAVERLHRDGPADDPTLQVSPSLQRFVGSIAARSDSGLTRWLLSDVREDLADQHDEERRRSREARIDAKEQRRRLELRENARRRRAEILRRAAKEVRSGWRTLRYATATRVHRVLVAANLRSEIPHSRGE